MSKCQMVKLGDMGKIVTGNTPKTSEGNNYSTQDIRFFKPSDFDEKRITPLDNSEYWISESARDKVRLLPINSILVTCIGTIGKVGIISCEATSNQQINAIIPSENVNSRALAYAILSRQAQLQAIANAPVVPIINKTQFSNFEVPLPPLDVQKHIADTLDKTQELIDGHNKQLVELDNLIKAVFYDTFGDPILNEKGWKVVKVIDVCGCMVPGRDKPKSFTGSIPWITIEDLNENGLTMCSKKGLGLTQEEISEVKRKSIPIGSVIMSCVGNLGITSIAGEEMVINQQLHSFQCSDKINNIYLKYTLPYFKNYMYKMATTTVIPYMNKSACNSIKIPLPSINLQNKFAQIVTNIEEQKSIIRQSLKESQNLFNSLMSKYFD